MFVLMKSGIWTGVGGFNPFGGKMDIYSERLSVRRSGPKRRTCAREMRARSQAPKLSIGGGCYLLLLLALSVLLTHPLASARSSPLVSALLLHHSPATSVA